MALSDSSIMVYLCKRDDQGRDLGESPMLLKQSKKKGVQLVETMVVKSTVIKTFNPVSVTLFRETEGADKNIVGRAAVGAVIAGPVGGIVGGMTGMKKKDAWFMEIKDADGSSAIMRLRNQGDGIVMKKAIEKHHMQL